MGNSLERKKLEEWKLDDSVKPLNLKYQVKNFPDVGKAELRLDTASFLPAEEYNTVAAGPLLVAIRGQLKNYNTIDEFRSLTDAQLQKRAEDWFQGLLAAEAPSVSDLLHAELFTYADLKGHRHSYRLNVPAVTEASVGASIVEAKAAAELPPATLSSLSDTLRALIQSKPTEFPFISFTTINAEGKVAPLITDLAAGISLLKSTGPDSPLLIFLDANNQPDLLSAFLKNVLAYLIRKTGGLEKPLKVLAVKDFIAKNQTKDIAFTRSILLTVEVKPVQDHPKFEVPGATVEVDLRRFMDEKALATDAVDLNIKLMKWQAAPEVDTELLKGATIVLFGAGTLGCQVSRVLLGWGVRKFHFIDYGRVAHSNPVRQSLYNFEDSTAGGQPKAKVAAEALKRIFPGVEAEGHVLSIPTPGHVVVDEKSAETIANDLLLLDQLVSKADAVFLLTDNRESRWLPTVLAARHDKLALTVALGFDSYLVMRHGVSSLKQSHEERLGCYFCNDVVAPMNTVSERTLDRQCTVVRPGISFLASAVAAELFVSLLHHPLRHAAPAHEEDELNESTFLGVLPQHLRGSLYDLSLIHI
eukprot:TRINITY_DN9394_c0_g1_i14.p1 TRINITY_DN9394_c0_g1~~TRINITY_DN9394_c0_g1_i14.p1  ORF type:complete len:599 (-),score=153.72 TRINITY_DN9394_c0_g1_i14:62-1819(-)